MSLKCLLRAPGEHFSRVQSQDLCLRGDTEPFSLGHSRTHQGWISEGMRLSDIQEWAIPYCSVLSCCGSLWKLLLSPGPRQGWNKRTPGLLPTQTTLGFCAGEGQKQQELPPAALCQVLGVLRGILGASLEICSARGWGCSLSCWINLNSSSKSSDFHGLTIPSPLAAPD